MASFVPKLPPLLHRSSRPESSRQQQQTQRQVSMSLTNKGLLNPTGHNNCFLNSCVQVLWHVDVFRRSFREFKGHTCVGDSCIFCALQELFRQFQHSRQSALPPDDLRKALASCYQEQHRFQLGIMDDAAECFEKILEQIHYHLTGSDDLDSCSAPHCLSHQKCALSVLEMTECQCGETSEPLAFVQFVHYISAPSLGAAANRMKKTLSSYTMGDGAVFGNLVRGVSVEGEERECETCHKVSPIRKMLLNSPDLVCIGMIWDSDQPNIDGIMSVVETVGTFLRVSDMFHRVMSDASSKEYCLSGMVAYYGHHYCTFCYHTVLRQWGFFDDANFRSIGSNWSDVVKLCRMAHYQPLLLVYANPFADKIAMTTAPTEVTKVVANDDKTSTLSPVVEEAQETGTVEKTLTSTQLANSGKEKQNTDTVASNSTSTTATTPTGGLNSGQSDSGTKSIQDSGSKTSHSTESHSGTKSSGDSGYTIDPNTLSIRRTPVPSLYPQLSLPGSGSEGGGEKEKEVAGGGSPVPSAPPMTTGTTSSSSSRPCKNSPNFPVIFQTPPPSTKQTTTPHSQQSSRVFPVFFQPTPSAPVISTNYQAFPSSYNSTPTFSTSSFLQAQAYSQPSGQRGGYNSHSTSHGTTTTAATATGGYPPPTHPRSHGNNTYYPGSNTSQSSPWRGGGGVIGGVGGVIGGGGGGGGGLPSFPQPQMNEQQLQQRPPYHHGSNPNSSPSLFQRKQLANTESTAGPSTSVPASPAKHSSHSQRASSMQPSSSSSSSARTRPSPPRSVPPPNLIENPANPSPSPPPSTDRDLIEFSLTPAHILGNYRPSLTQGHPYQPPPTSTLSSKDTSAPGTKSERPSEGGGRGNGSERPSERRPEREGGRGDGQLSSVEEDLIQLSMSPDFIQKMQRYRGRQGLRQGSSDSLRLGTSQSTGRRSNSRSGSGEERKKTTEIVPGGMIGNGLSSMNSATASSVSQPRPATERSMDEHEKGTSVSRQGRTDTVSLETVEPATTNRGRSEGERETVAARERIPDPLYADPDEIINITTTTATPTGQHAPNTTTTGGGGGGGGGGGKGGSGGGSQGGGGGGGGGEGEEERKERPGLGEDPLYAVPEQVAAKIRAKNALSTPTVQSPTTPGGIPETVQPVLREALEVWRKAESKRDTDIAIAKISYSRAATLLTKVLLDPSVDKTLKQNISHKRQEALSKCSEMESLLNHKQRETVYGGDGRCRQCGQTRQLNSDFICGPCHLKNKISQ